MQVSLSCNIAPFFERSEKQGRSSSTISVYATLTPTKMQTFSSVSFRRSLLCSTFTSLRQKTAFSGLSFRGFTVAPQKVSNVALAVTPQEADKMPAYNAHFFHTSLPSYYLEMELLLIRSISKLRSRVSALAFLKFIS